MPAPYDFKGIFSSFYCLHQHVRTVYCRFNLILGYRSPFHLSFGMSAEPLFSFVTTLIHSYAKLAILRYSTFQSFEERGNSGSGNSGSIREFGGIRGQRNSERNSGSDLDYYNKRNSGSDLDYYNKRVREIDDRPYSSRSYCFFNCICLLLIL